MMLDYVVALGSNLEDRLAYLQSAVDQLAVWPDLWLKKVSSVYETDPVGYMDQGPFLNMVIVVSSSKSPAEILGVLLEVENGLGRKRTFRNAPRTIDLDLIFAGDQVIAQGPGLIIPHPRMHERSFVLSPLAEIAPGQVHPLLGETVAALNERITGKGGVRWYSKLSPNDSVPTGN